MMKIQQSRLASLCGIAAAMVTECRLMITESGINTLAVDAANVGMVSINLPKEQFEEFSEAEKIEIGMDIPKWKNMLDAMKDPKSIIVIERTKDNGRLKVTDGKYTYQLAMLDVNTVRKRPNPPNITLQATIAIDAKEFKEAVRAMGVVGDKVKFATEPAGLAMDAGGDTDHLHKVFDARDGTKQPAAPVSSLFSHDYLKEVSKAMQDAGTISANVGQDHPIRFDFDLDGMECSYLIAPRIEGD